VSNASKNILGVIWVKKIRCQIWWKKNLVSNGCKKIL